MNKLNHQNHSNFILNDFNILNATIQANKNKNKNFINLITNSNLNKNLLFVKFINFDIQIMINFNCIRYFFYQLFDIYYLY